MCDDAGESLFVLGRALLFCIRGGCAHEEAVVTFFDLLDRVGIVVAGACVSARYFQCHSLGRRDIRCDRYISTVQHGGPAVKRVGVEGNVVATAESYLA